ncbi:MAG: hypothetical protein ACREDR_08120 [Blastocatellia bacterium]
MELIPLKPEQHQVILVPKATTDLPFFYHTKKKSLLNKNILYEGLDPQGRPMRWKTIPNRDPEIGVPGIDAHEVWMRLVKPTIDLRLNLYDEQSYVVPLGGCRYCLRMVGWGEGGFQARRLFKALNQIGMTNCIADIWIPTTETDERGDQVFRPIKASFTKMSIYAIGSTHLTEEQLKDGRFNFDFDLDDTIYIQLNPIEAQIQKSQPQRYIDNQYLFSVDPKARRAYELLAAKAYGVVKNKGTHFEVLYSWYVSHHHTLKRHYERRRVTQQIRDVNRDHLRKRYFERIEFATIKEPGKEIDWIIRFYPGETAKESIARILGYTAKRKQKPHLNRRDHPAFTDASQPIPMQQPTRKEPGEEASLLTQLTKRGIAAAQARKLLKAIEPEQQVMDQLEWGDYIVAQGSIKNPPGLYVSFIKDNLMPPDSFETSRKLGLKQDQAQTVSSRQQEDQHLQLAYADYRNQEIDKYVAQNHEEYERFYFVKKQESQAKFGGFADWKPELATKFVTVLARAEVAKRLPFDDFETFRSRLRQVESAPAQSPTQPEFPGPPTTQLAEYKPFVYLLALPAPGQGSHSKENIEVPKDQPLAVEEQLLTTTSLESGTGEPAAPPPSPSDSSDIPYIVV